jgi:enoyl-CoA hydratase
VHAVVITGAPPAFCAGANLGELGAAHEEGLRSIYAGFLAVAGCTLPTIAAVGGAAVGAGLNLALACDVRVAGPRARFDARFLQLGIHPGGGMTWMLQRVVGPQTALAMTVFGQTLDADTAERRGLVVQVVDGDHAAVVDAAVALAGPAATAPRELVVATKQTLRTTAGLAEHADAVEVELTAQLRSMKSPAFTELLAAMREKISGSG